MTTAFCKATPAVCAPTGGCGRADGPESLGSPARRRATPPPRQGLRLDDDSLDAASPIRDRGPLWFGRGAGDSWGFALLDARTDITSSDVVGRYGGLFVVYVGPGQVVDLTSDGRRWAVPRTLPADGRPAGVLTAVSLGRQLIAWDDAGGLHLASRTIPGAWSTTTVTRTGRPRSIGLTAVSGKATVIYGVTTAEGFEVRSRTQR